MLSSPNRSVFLVAGLCVGAAACATSGPAIEMAPDHGPRGTHVRSLQPTSAPEVWFMNDLDGIRARLGFAAIDGTGGRQHGRWDEPLRCYAGDSYYFNTTVYLEFEPEVYRNPAFVREFSTSFVPVTDALIRLSLPAPEERRFPGPGLCGRFDVKLVHEHAARLDSLALEQLIQAVGRLGGPREGLGTDPVVVESLPGSAALGDPEIGGIVRAVTLAALSELQIVYHLSRHTGGPPGPVARVGEGTMGYALTSLAEVARRDAKHLDAYLEAVRAELSSRE